MAINYYTDGVQGTLSLDPKKEGTTVGVVPQGKQSERPMLSANG